jgi:hypothetical protein
MGIAHKRLVGKKIWLADRIESQCHCWSRKGKGRIRTWDGRKRVGKLR